MNAEFILAQHDKAIQEARLNLTLSPIYLDTETTGLGDNDQIVEIGILGSDGSTLVSTLVNPTIAIPAAATAVHGITEDMVKDAPTWAELWPQVSAIIGANRVAIYNATYDLRMMYQSCWAHGLKPDRIESAFCVMKLYAAYHGQWNYRKSDFKWQSLTNASQQMNITIENTHRAIDDCRLTRNILEAMAHGGNGHAAI